MTQFTTLTEQTARDLIDLLRRDRSHPRGGPARVGNLGQQGQVPVRWGKTTATPDYPTYPSSGNVVGVSLGNYEPSPLYPGATAVKTFTAYSPPIYVFATLENGSLPAEGAEVRLTWRNGMWWILQESSSAPKCYLHGIRVYRPTDGYMSNRYIQYNRSPGSIYWTDSMGDVSGCNLLINTASVAASTDYGIKVTAAGWYEFDWRVTAYDVTADVDTSYYESTTSSNGAQGTHVHGFTSGAATSGNGSATHTHGGAVAADGATHTHSTTVSGTTNADGSFAAHTHTVRVPSQIFGLRATSSIRWRPSGGIEGDWQLLASASSVFAPFPCLDQPYSGTTTSVAPRGILYLAENAEIIFRMQVNGEGAGASQYDDAAAQVNNLPSNTNCTVVYHGNSLATASHYP